MGSVKDLQILENPTKEKTGRGRFNFSDRYSVFDWGEMPDLIDGKGSALCMTSAYFFEKIEDKGIATHYIGLVEDGKTKRLSEIKRPSSSLDIKLVRVLKPEFKNNKYDYAIYKKERINFLIPLEVIYRNSLPEGSSVFKRLKNGSLSFSALGLSKMPEPGMVLDKPIFDVSTKLESSDRYIDWREAGEISGLNDAEIEILRKAVSEINSLISKEAKNAGLVNEDGKIEFGFGEQRRLILLDTVGTLDECRFTYGGVPVSKEILRMHYRDTPWHSEVEAAKKTSGKEWKKLVKSCPQKLPAELKKLMSQLYMATCNKITGREWFKNMPDVADILREITK